MHHHHLHPAPRKTALSRAAAPTSSKQVPRHRACGLLQAQGAMLGSRPAERAERASPGPHLHVMGLALFPARQLRRVEVRRVTGREGGGARSTQGHSTRSGTIGTIRDAGTAPAHGGHGRATTVIAAAAPCMYLHTRFYGPARLVAQRVPRASINARSGATTRLGRPSRPRAIAASAGTVTHYLLRTLRSPMVAAPALLPRRGWLLTAGAGTTGRGKRGLRTLGG